MSVIQTVINGLWQAGNYNAGHHSLIKFICKKQFTGNIPVELHLYRYHNMAIKAI